MLLFILTWPVLSVNCYYRYCYKNIKLYDAWIKCKVGRLHKTVIVATEICGLCYDAVYSCWIDLLQEKTLKDRQCNEVLSELKMKEVPIYLSAEITNVTNEKINFKY